jgi:hypothetical protein
MPLPYEQYTEELHQRYGYLATWLPSTKLHLGDVGTLRRDRFELVTTLNHLGIEFATRDISEAADYEYISANGASLQFDFRADADGIEQALGKSMAKVAVRFSRENAVLFMAKGCKASHIEQQDRLGAEVLARHDNGNWEKTYVVITELVTAESATILISGQANARVEFSGETGIAPQGITLADLSAGLRIASSSGVATHIFAAKQLTPLFRASGIRTRFPFTRSFTTRSSGKNRPNFGFSNLLYEDLETGNG